jgi:hypothetical protein
MTEFHALGDLNDASDRGGGVDAASVHPLWHGLSSLTSSHPKRVPLYLVLRCFCLVQPWSFDSLMLCKCNAMFAWWMKSSTTR